jgi:alpha-L-fucosidase
MPMRLVLVLLLAVATLNLAAGAEADHVAAIQETETKAQKDVRMAWWRAARFGMFIHWGLYSIPAKGEWVMCNDKIPVADYKALAAQFNPTKFDADAWVAVAKAAGMKYMVITAKHHDGFAMFDSKVDPFNIVDATPFKRDPMKELAAACQKAGIKFGFYYSQSQDWTAVGGAARFGHWDKAQDGDYATYFKTKAIPQVQELLSNYQPFPAVIWFDTPTSMTPEIAGEMVKVLNQHPNLIWNNRLGASYSGDTETPEGSIPTKGYPGRDWETCMTLNDSWGYNKGDLRFKSTQTLLDNLIDIASKGGNYLLNVGPDSTGTIPQPEVDRLLQIGKWLDVNGAAIYGTSGSPFHQALDWGRVTQSPGKLYLHVFNWPADGKFRVPITNQVTKAYLLASPQTSLAMTKDHDGVVVQLPGTPPSTDALPTVAVLEINGSPACLFWVRQADNGVLTLTADDAILEGDSINLGNGSGEPALFWSYVTNYAHWNIRINKPGTYKVAMEYALDPSSPGVTITITAGDQTMTAVPPKTANWGEYKLADVGTITFPHAGDYDFKFSGVKNGPYNYLVDPLRKLVLTPVP